ncbi:ferrochelatase [Liquorilactobacillus satsumensis]|uniref:ferrochelatase n=1 Tax=Liquorilactobacillus satsumensis TaxID=259059 RepID=UPI0039EA40DC
MKKGILLINLGTPVAPTAAAVRPYLRRFLGDPRVIAMPRLLWKPILELMILPKRPAASAKMYQAIWSQDYGSPLAYYTQKQATRLQALLPDRIVKYAFSYSAPFIPEVLREFAREQVEELTIIPLYPQYSTTTVGSVTDEITAFYHKSTFVPNLRVLTSFYQAPDYIEVLAAKIKNAWQQKHYDKLLLSYHGIPESYVAKGDPYARQCHATTQLLREKLGTIPVLETFQSKFGRAKWLEPATDHTLKSLPQTRIKNVLVVSPAFVSDCLETLHELQLENREYFMSAGGQTYDVVPCLNDDEDFIKVLKNLAVAPADQHALR